MTGKTKDVSKRAADTPQPKEATSTPGTHETPHVHSHTMPQGGRYLFILALSALGVVYGDIGTSPLYALRECFNGLHAIEPTPTNIFGVLSLIFWSLIIVITLKYIVFILQADNNGEGGILALTALATPIRRLERYSSALRRWGYYSGDIRSECGRRSQDRHTCA